MGRGPGRPPKAAPPMIERDLPFRRVLVAGGRNYFKLGRVTEVLETFKEVTEDEGRHLLLCTGDATGADTAAQMWARVAGVDQVKMPANWVGRGKQAGTFRNQLMLDIFQPEVVIAFPGGFGTADMIERARKRGITVRVIEDGYQGQAQS